MSANCKKYATTTNKEKNLNPKMKIIFKCLSASNLGGNPYYNYLISAAVEIPGNPDEHQKSFAKTSNLQY